MRTPVGFVLLVAFLALMAMVAIVVILLRAPSTADQLTLIGAVIAFMTPLITSVIALFRAEHANGIAHIAAEKVETHLENDGAPATPGV